MAQGCYVETNNIPEQSRAFIFEVLRSEGLEGFLYVIEDNVLSTFYEKIDYPHAKLFVEERVSRFGKSFVKVDSFYSCADKNVVYYSVVDTKERLQSAYERLKRTVGFV